MRHRVFLRIVVLAVFAFAMQAVSAAEVVRFTDGRYLEVTSHEIHGQGIRLTVDREGVIVLPLGQVEKIERGGLVVFHIDQDRAAPREPRGTKSEPTIAVAQLETSHEVRRAEGRSTRR